ncbi:hypothetical protein C7974DRAFT_92762 [Boeremia exigua]|uniref:uncharacterized protein n=1 Tax=Boeremia exigua TaxID=749465 RepID=UPI001E8D2487|nr:uncharacterized protein C7974DRAFT_92762 [Boeremia exigua]KAH6641948.1 hypothetical protein C7974DRAFT_92762 [Boeremia exigua]
MFEHFELRHFPPLFIATTTAFGGTMPLWNPEKAILTFGFPQNIASSRPAHPVMAVGSARITCTGIALWALYLKGHLEAMDIVLASLGWLALVDGYIVLQESGRGKATFRFLSAAVVAIWGMLGMTAGR